MDIFVFEGSVIEAPNGSGRMDMFADRPMKDWVTDLAKQADVVVTIGDCACGAASRRWSPTRPPRPACSTTSATRAASSDRTSSPRWLPSSTSRGAWHTLTGSPRSVALATGRLGDIALDDLHARRRSSRPSPQTGCTCVQFYEYKQSTMSFGEGTRTGCLFYEFGCRGPMTHSPCNRILWNRQSSKTRASQPCYGCTEPEFPHFDLAPGTLFKTQKVAG